MSETPVASAADQPALPRAIADAYVDALADLDPITGQYLGISPGDDRLPDFSPAGLEALADLSRRTLERLDAAEAAHPALDEAERRCAKLLRERLTSGLAVHEAGEGLRAVSNLNSPVHSVRSVFVMMPTATDEDWAAIEGRLRNVPAALAGYRESLQAGLDRGLPAGPRQVAAVVGQLGEWVDGDRSWFAEFVSAGPQERAGRLTEAAGVAAKAVAGLRDWLRDDYAPAIAGTPDPVGRERYALWARQWNGADLDLDEAYAWGWQEFLRIEAEMRAEAGKVLPGATPREAMAHLEREGQAIEGVEEVRAWLQTLMDEAIDALDGTHFDLSEPVRKVEAMIAPPGSAAAPYYTGPSLDFSRPGRTWLPTMGETRFPVYDLVSTWYHEGVPGHHLQLAQWVHVADRLSRYQATIGLVSANVEGWALYAERLMDELGFLTDPGRRLGYLDAQQMRAVRVIIDIGMHLGLPVPDDAGERIGWDHGGETWTPELAREFFGRHSGRPTEFLDSELIRYLGMPGQAIGYKLGERAWLAGREAARRAHGADFDPKAWHMAALSLGSLGLDDLLDELSKL
ncbi:MULTISPECIES: DUF885 domain-containing protein [Streptomycetaceae]|uniref:DUF885 domain-containing protein n=1 Tax=Streptantibioticus cattleyicolor (strain ATCC 35852 / DSM 46488 / JCM 4925 / NBRC 14057 / NRRL 8057) TaxID=1003195 RepID=F8JPR4_STREN|nr:MULTISPECIES: DUF885 domain-containing protein [Streptomycetaceae]AEW92755.1 protein of unknown function DUF885 [Streptantibioticus cattleyicolor NRRL 8057 = DSM 46488]MYS57520.1 DUF885 family protein [Streptomyces sp. SID5468]CCB73111.1 conserved protein of unknown function [Streptantibioticus cattleyicolor NRRL 8057 = DSM 46488]